MEIQKLSVSERIMLAEALWDSVHNQDAEIEITEAQRRELDKRLAALELDLEPGASWSEVRQRIISDK